MGTGFKNPHFGGSYTHSEKNYTRTSWGEGGPPILPLGGGTPFLRAFWPFWAKVAQTGEFLGPPLECKVFKKSVTYPWGGG